MGGLWNGFGVERCNTNTNTNAKLSSLQSADSELEYSLSLRSYSLRLSFTLKETESSSRGSIDTTNNQDHTDGSNLQLEASFEAEEFLQKARAV